MAIVGALRNRAPRWTPPFAPFVPFRAFRVPNALRVPNPSARRLQPRAWARPCAVRPTLLHFEKLIR